MLIAHLTDLHLGLQAAPGYCPIDPELGLQRALTHVRQLQPAVDVVLLSGDLAESGAADSYAKLATLLHQGLPDHEHKGPLVLAVPGNHDDPALARRMLAPWMPVADDAPSGRCCLHVTHQGLHFIGLDTVVPDQPHGAIGPDQLDWLERTLQRCANEPVLIFMHHPPLVTSMTVMDTFGLRQGRQELAALVARHGQVQLIAAGHQHRPIAGALGGVPVVVAPSTSHQLKLDLRLDAPLALCLEPAMIGLYRWNAKDGMACHLSHVTNFDTLTFQPSELEYSVAHTDDTP